jgi:hypothetical protein
MHPQPHQTPKSTASKNGHHYKIGLAQHITTFTTLHPSPRINTNTLKILIRYIATIPMDPSNPPWKKAPEIGSEKKPDMASTTQAKILILTKGYMDYKTYYEPR